MSVRRTIVDIDTTGLNVTRFCADHGIGTSFFYDVRARYALEGAAALEPKSRAPHTVANRTPIQIEDAIVAKRKELVDAGLDAGAESIWDRLEGLQGRPSPSTIWRILRNRGFITPEPRKAPRGAYRSFTAARANECWQLDDTSWWLADGTEIKILDVIDDHSRLLVASTAMATCTGAAALAALAAAATVLGWPARFLSDNAPAFRHVVAEAVGHLGVAAGHSRPYHPQTNGKVERFHQTLKRWLAKQAPAATLTQLQTQLDLFRILYNHHRPHRSIGRCYPADVWAAAPKSGPADRPLSPAVTTATHLTTVRGGRVEIGQPKYAITVGAAYNSQPALSILTGLQCHIFIDGRFIRSLTIDPTRRFQALYNRLGPPRT